MVDSKLLIFGVLLIFCIQDVNSLRGNDLLSVKLGKYNDANSREKRQAEWDSWCPTCGRTSKDQTIIEIPPEIPPEIIVKQPDRFIEPVSSMMNKAKDKCANVPSDTICKMLKHINSVKYTAG